MRMEHEAGGSAGLGAEKENKRASKQTIANEHRPYIDKGSV